jgi:coenzyme F420-0:L-glutamate ligase/coenzyme F420-1:gamma-L-glutamate ligase
MGQAAEGRPVVIMRGLGKPLRDGNAAELVRPKKIDLFR